MTAIQDDILRQMFADGYALIDFISYFGEELWNELEASVFEFRHSSQYAEQREMFLRGDGKGKEFLIRPSWTNPEGPWKVVAENPILTNAARTYFVGGDPLLADCDLWCTEPMPEGRERTYSQNWHVDLEAQRFSHRIFKAFLYFNDIGEGNGPLEIWDAGSSLQSNTIRKMCVEAGTMLLVDTGALLHRGGYCETGPRTLGLWYYTNGSPFTVPPLVSGRLAAERATRV